MQSNPLATKVLDQVQLNFCCSLSPLSKQIMSNVIKIGLLFTFCFLLRPWQNNVKSQPQLIRFRHVCNLIFHVRSVSHYTMFMLLIMGLLGFWPWAKPRSRTVIILSLDLFQDVSPPLYRLVSGECAGLNRNIRNFLLSWFTVLFGLLFLIA